LQISEPGKLAHAAKPTFYRNMSLVLPRTSRTNFCSKILKLFQNLFLQTLSFVQWFSNHSRTRSSIQELGSHYVVYIIRFRWRSQRGTSINHYYCVEFQLNVSLSYSVIKSFLSDLFHSGLSKFRLRKHSDLMFCLTYQSISIDLNVFHLSIKTIY
jgi:hypothetical protein